MYTPKNQGQETNESQEEEEDAETSEAFDHFCTKTEVGARNSCQTSSYKQNFFAYCTSFPTPFVGQALTFFPVNSCLTPPLSSHK